MITKTDEIQRHQEMMGNLEDAKDCKKEGKLVKCMTKLEEVILTSIRA